MSDYLFPEDECDEDNFYDQYDNDLQIAIKDDEHPIQIETNRDEEGNINSPPLPLAPPQATQKIDWSFTWNNYPVDARETLVHVFGHLCRAYQFQSEIGKKGTPHLQGMIKCLKKMRWTEFKLPKEIYWSKTRDEEKSLAYTMKDDTFDEKANIRESYGYPAPLIFLKEVDFRPWQKSLRDLIRINPDDRHIIWVYDEYGNTGKSQFARHMGIVYNTPILKNSKTSDMASYFIKNNINITECVIFDFPKQTEKINYQLLEAMKDGYLQTGKFEGGCKYFNPPHVIVFSNDMPSTTRTLSVDRFKLYTIIEMQLIQTPLEE